LSDSDLNQIYKIAPVESLFSSTNGGLSGYASTFHFLDYHNDIIAPGAYQGDIERFLRKGFIGGIGHNHDDPIGKPVELTETAALIDIEESMRFVSRIRALGARVAIDDFGAGYTSFRNLQSLKVDMVKVDGSFVKGLAECRDNQIFVSTLVNLAKNFNLSTVAEWVGNEEEAEILRGFGVDYFQGMYFGKPDVVEPWSKR
jgi:hypothetical protein